MKQRKRFGKKVLSIIISVCMLIGSIPAANLTTVFAEEGSSELLTTIWKEANIGSNTGGSYNYDETAKTITVEGAGTMFDKDSAQDNLYFAYFDTKSGKTTITAKVSFSGGLSGGFAGILARNDNEVNSPSAAVYADYKNGNKDQIRYGYHTTASGGASQLNSMVSTGDVYIKLIIENGKMTAVSCNDGNFEAQTPKAQTIAGLDAKEIGFFATEGVTAVFSEVKITSEYTENTIDYKKIVFDSELGELKLTQEEPVASDSNKGVLEITADGPSMILKKEARGTANTETLLNHWYYLFPKTFANYTITADVTSKVLSTSTEHQGFFMGVFNLDSAGQSYFAASNIHKNFGIRTYYRTNAAAGWDRSKCSVTLTQETVINTMYNLSATREDTGIRYGVKDASGNNMIPNAANGGLLEFGGETGVSSELDTTQEVQYGFAIAGATVEVKNLQLIDEDGFIVYDQNDYYKVKGVAPVVEAVSAAVNADRSAIDLTWTNASEGAGNVTYVVLVKKDGGEYALASVVNSASYKYVLSTDGEYQFKVYGRAGDSSSEAEAKESDPVPFVTPLTLPVLNVTADSVKTSLSWAAVPTADSYDIYRQITFAGQAELLTNVTGTTYDDTDVMEEVPYCYYIVAKNSSTGNTSNPSVTQQTLTTDGHAGTYVYGTEAADFELVSRSDSTVFSDTASISMKYNEAGTAALVVNNVVVDATPVSAGETVVHYIDLVQGRNDVDIVFADSENLVSRMTFSFVSNPLYDIVVDASFTGDDGAEVNGYKTYKTITAAIASVDANNDEPKVIFIKNGSYMERLVIETPYISLLGQDNIKTKIFHNVAVANAETTATAIKATGMWDRNVVYVGTGATGFSAENLYMENTFPYTNGSNEQADVLCIAADKTICVNLRLIGYQDTLCTDSRTTGAQTRQAFYKCYITGNVDFIYGSGTSYFEDCDIVARYTPYKADGCYTAARTAEANLGYVFVDCRFLFEAGVGAKQYRLARPWGADASTTFIACFMDEAVADAGYGDMSGNSYKNARFAEFYSYGPAFKVNNDRPLLSEEQLMALDSEIAAKFDYMEQYEFLYNDPWFEVGNQIDMAQPDEVVVVEMNDEKVIPGYIIDQIAEQGTTVEFELDNGAVWIIDGSAITGSGFDDMNINVILNSGAIPQDLVDAVEITDMKVSDSLQITLEGAGEFGFAMTLLLNLTSENAGKTAYLYYRDPETGDLELTYSAEILDNGDVYLEFTHASDYVVLVAEEEIITGDGTSPQTGDSTPVTALVVLMGATACTFAAARRKRKVFASYSYI